MGRKLTFGNFLSGRALTTTLWTAQSYPAISIFSSAFLRVPKRLPEGTGLKGYSGLEGYSDVLRTQGIRQGIRP